MSDPKQPFGAGISPKSAALDDLERQSAAEGTTGGLSASGSQSEQRQGEQAQVECEPLEGGERGAESNRAASERNTNRKRCQDRRRENGKHLKPWHWKPGQSGNPSGRPKGRITVTQQVKRRLAMDPAECKVIVDAWLERCKGPNGSRDLALLLDRTEGLLTKKVQVEAAHRKVLGFRDPLQGTELEQPEEPRTLDLTQGDE